MRNSIPFRTIRYASAVTVCLGFLIPAARSEEDTKVVDPAHLTLERIFDKEEFNERTFSARWLEDREGYTFLKKLSTENQDDADVDKQEKIQEIWRFIPGDPEPSLMIAAPDLIPPGHEKPLSIDSYAFSKDLSLVLIYTNSKRVWRRNTRGDYWLLDRDRGALRQLGGDAPPSSLMFAKISPGGGSVAYVRERNIYIESLDDHSIRSLTTTPTKDIINGTADWVYEEELFVRDGFRWSPDGTSIAYWQFDESGVEDHVLVDNLSGLYPKLQLFGYPKVGQKNAACRVGVVTVSNGKTRWLDVPGDPRNHYLARMEWAESSGELILQQLNRPQNEIRVYLANAGDGTVTKLFTESDEAWADIPIDVKWGRDGSHFTWLSDRDGWKHLYLVSRDGSSQKCLTPGNFDVIKIANVDDKHRWIDFIASPDDPSARFLYRVNFDGSGLRRLTPSSEKRGTHSYNISTDGAYAIYTSSTFDDPPVTRLISLPDHLPLQILEDNADLVAKVEALDRAPVEFFYVDIGEPEALHGRCVVPPDFDPAGSYPLLMYVYGEPAGQVVTDRWGGGHNRQLWHSMLAQQGYVVMSIDNRGTRAPRGRAWRKAANRQIGILAPKQQASALQKVLSERRYLDPDRVGVWGWSGGGSMSLNAIFKYPELYKMAIAVASVPDQRHYDTIYQERYMGLPSENAEAFREGSPINFADQLEGNLLLIHGLQDDNCHYQTYEKLIDRLISLNKQFSMMIYPRGTHEIKEGKNTRLHFYSLLTQFVHQHLPVETDSDMVSPSQKP